MSTRLWRLAAYAPLLALAALLAFGTAVPTRAASGAALVQYAWWTEANYVNGITPTDQAPPAPDRADLHAAIGPLVSDDPYSIQHDSPTGAVEVSAVMFQLPNAVPFTVDPAAPVATLKLTIDPNFPPSGTVIVLACRTLDSWSAELSGNWSQRATYQAGCSVGVTNDGGKSYDFTILASQLSGGRVVDMAIAPTLDPTALPFKVWFKPPVGADLTPLALPVSSADTFAVPQEPVAESAPLTGSGYPTTAFATNPAPPPTVAAPQVGGPTTPPPATPQLATAVAHPVVDTAARVVAGVLLLAVLLAMMSAAGMDMQRLLTPAGQVGGVGRFRRQRGGPPLPL
jgi:hypothetical protein